MARVSRTPIILAVTLAALALAGCSGGGSGGGAPLQTPAAGNNAPVVVGCPAGAITALSKQYQAAAEAIGAGPDSAAEETAANAPFAPIAGALAGACIWRHHGEAAIGHLSAATDQDYALIHTGDQTTAYQTLVSAAKQAEAASGGVVTESPNSYGGTKAYLQAPPASGETSDTGNGYAECWIETTWDPGSYAQVNWLIANEYSGATPNEFVMLVCSSTHSQ